MSDWLYMEWIDMTRVLVHSVRDCGMRGSVSTSVIGVHVDSEGMQWLVPSIGQERRGVWVAVISVGSVNVNAWRNFACVTQLAAIQSFNRALAGQSVVGLTSANQLVAIN